MNLKTILAWADLACAGVALAWSAVVLFSGNEPSGLSFALVGAAAGFGAQAKHLFNGQ